MPRGSIFGSPWCPACSRIRSRIIQAGCIFCGSRLGPSVFCADACRILNLFNVRDDIFRFFRPGAPRSKNLAALATQLASKWHPKSALVTQLALKWHPKSSKRRHLLDIFGTTQFAVVMVAALDTYANRTLLIIICYIEVPLSSSIINAFRQPAFGGASLSSILIDI